MAFQIKGLVLKNSFLVKITGLLNGCSDLVKLLRLADSDKPVTGKVFRRYQLLAQKMRDP
jgi:hypothetical protein